MKFLEKNLEDILFEADQEEVRDRGLEDFYYNKIYRQFNLGNYGTADLITINYYNWCKDQKEFIITVYELKQEIINVNTILQCSRYIQGVKRFIKKYFQISGVQIQVLGVVIGNNYDEKNKVDFLLQSIEGITGYVYEYKIDGLEFSKIENYILSVEEFSNKRVVECKKHLRQIIKAYYPHG